MLIPWRVYEILWNMASWWLNQPNLENISQTGSFPQFSGWKWKKWNHHLNGIFSISTGLGFLPSTVLQWSPWKVKKDMKSGLVKFWWFPEFMACYRKVWLIGIYLCLYTPFESKMFNENRRQFWMIRWKHLFSNGRLGISNIIDIVKPSFGGPPIKTSRPEKTGWYSYIINPRYTPYIVGIYRVYSFFKGLQQGGQTARGPHPKGTTVLPMM